MKPKLSRLTFNLIADRFCALQIPDGRDCDNTNHPSVSAYQAAWEKLASDTDGLAKDIVRNTATPRGASERKLAKSLFRHVERLREHAEATSDFWERARRWREGGKLNIFEIAWTLMGNTTEKERWAKSESRAISAQAGKLSKAHVKLLRDHELLHVQLNTFCSNNGHGL